MSYRRGSWRRRQRRARRAELDRLTRALPAVEEIWRTAFADLHQLDLTFEIDRNPEFYGYLGIRVTIAGNGLGPVQHVSGLLRTKIRQIVRIHWVVIVSRHAIDWAPPYLLGEQAAAARRQAGEYLRDEGVHLVSERWRESWRAADQIEYPAEYEERLLQEAPRP